MGRGKKLRCGEGKELRCGKEWKGAISYIA